MSFSDQPPPSLLRIWPLLPLGRWAARLIHRAKDGPDGSLMSRKHIIPGDVAWRLGQAYLGMLGLLALPSAWAYVKAFHQDTGYQLGNWHVLGFWSDLSLDLKIVMPLTFILHVIGVVSFIRWALVVQELRPLGDAP